MHVKVIAHRGASALAPENTLAAFEKALYLGVDGIELDVQLTRDGELVVCHDERVDRTTDGVGLVKDFSLTEIKRLDAGSWFGASYRGERIPTLGEVLELIKHKQVLLNIEIKSGVIVYPDIESKVIDLLERYSYIEQAIVSSFNHYSLVAVRQLNSSVATGVLYMAGLYQPWEYARKLGANAIHPYFYSAKPEIIAGARQTGVKIHPFTVDDPVYLKQLIAAQVDAVITNYPDRALAIVKGAK